MDLVFHWTVGKAIVSGIEVFQGDSLPPVTTTWQEAAPAPLPLFEAQGTAVGEKLYLFGGFYNGAVQATPAVNVYDAATNTLARPAHQPPAGNHAGLPLDGATPWGVGRRGGD